jgi:hypothetical protein
MPNWCYNNTELSIDNSLFDEVSNILKFIKYEDKELPKDIRKKITDILFDYDENTDEQEYMDKLIREVREEMEIGGGIGDSYFSYNSKWGPSSSIWASYSKDYPFIMITNDYDSTEDDYEGSDIILNGEYIKEESWSLSEKNWEENSKGCEDKILEILLSDDFSFENEDGDIISFNNINDIKKFYIKNGDDSFNILSDEFDIYDFMNEMDLDNCEEQIQTAFENKYINNN